MSEVIFNILHGLWVLAGVAFYVAIFLALPVYLVHILMPAHYGPACFLIVVISMLLLIGLYVLGEKVRYG